MGINEMLATFGAENVKAVTAPFLPNPKEKRAQQAHEMKMAYQKSIIDKTEADIKATGDDQQRKDIILNKGILNNHVIGASDEYNRALKETGGNIDLAAEAGKEYFRANIESYLAAGDEGEDEGLQQGLELNSSEFGNILQMMRSGVPAIQKHLRKMEELGVRKSGAKAPKTRSIGDQIGGKNFIVQQEYIPESKTWKEVGRREVGKGQTYRAPHEKALGKEFVNILESATNAENQLFTVQKARALIPDIESGKLEPIKTWARQWGEAMGVSIDSGKMNDSISFRAVMKNAVLDGMASIKGTASEADRKTVEDAVANLENPMEANKFLIDTTESLAKRNIEMADFWDNWSAVNGDLTGVRKAWSKRINNIPLIKLVNKTPHHYYQFKDKAIEINKAYFEKKGWNENRINDEVDRLWIEQGT